MKVRNAVQISHFFIVETSAWVRRGFWGMGRAQHRDEVQAGPWGMLTASLGLFTACPLLKVLVLRWGWEHIHISVFTEPLASAKFWR